MSARAVLCAALVVMTPACSHPGEWSKEEIESGFASKFDAAAVSLVESGSGERLGVPGIKFKGTAIIDGKSYKIQAFQEKETDCVAYRALNFSDLSTHLLKASLGDCCSEIRDFLKVVDRLDDALEGSNNKDEVSRLTQRFIEESAKIQSDQISEGCKKRFLHWTGRFEKLTL